MSVKTPSRRSAQRGPGHVAAWARCLAASGILAATLPASPAEAASELRVRVDPPPTGSREAGLQADSDSLVAGFRIEGLFPEDQPTTLGEGIPATLTLEVGLWRVRDAWWDSLVRSFTFSYRFRRDPLRDVYDVLDPDRSRREFRGRDALRDYLERRHEVLLGRRGNYDPGARFTLSVKATVEPLKLNDLEVIDAWLSGDVTEGRTGGGILGIPRAFLGLAFDLSGLGDKNAVGRSAMFTPRPD